MKFDKASCSKQNENLSSHCACAQVAELADALDSGSSGRKVVEVRVLSWAPFIPQHLRCSCLSAIRRAVLLGVSSGVSWFRCKALHRLAQMGLSEMGVPERCLYSL